jgi:hypothetical protein
MPALFSGLFLLGVSVLPAIANAQDADPRHGLDAEETAVLAQINAYRAANGIGPLTASPLLDAVAYDHSADMAARQYFDHVTPEGASPFDRMRSAGYDGGAMGENLAAGNADAGATFEQWRTSPHHNAAMLNGAYHVIGIGRVNAPGTQYQYYWTTVFGDQADASVHVAPVATPPAPVAAPLAPPPSTPTASTTAAPAASPAPAGAAPAGAAGTDEGDDDSDGDEAAPTAAPQPTGEDAPPVEFLPRAAAAAPAATPSAQPGVSATAPAPVATPRRAHPVQLRIPVGRLRSALRHPRARAALQTVRHRASQARAHLPTAPRVIVVDIEHADRADNN